MDLGTVQSTKMIHIFNLYTVKIYTYLWLQNIFQWNTYWLVYFCLIGIYVVPKRRKRSSQMPGGRSSCYGLFTWIFPQGEKILRLRVHSICQLLGSLQHGLQLCPVQTFLLFTAIEQNYNYNKFHRCRKTQAVFDKCALDNLNIERPYFGYFSEVKVHHTERPRPPGIMKPSDFPDRPDALPDDEPRPPAKFGNRKSFFN